MDLSILIVNWNSKEYLQKCLHSILVGAGDKSFEIVVVDSASYDGCGEMLEAEFPRVRFIQSRENLGFARANNLAFEASTGKVVLFLNPDTEVKEGAIDALYAALNDVPRAGAVGGRLLNSDGTLQTSCVQAFPTIMNQVLSAEPIRRLTPRAGIWGMKVIFDDQLKVAEVEMISGACLMMRRDVFEKIGRFSPEYFMYAEDVDLCYKAHRKGFSNIYVPEAVIVHHGGGSSQKSSSNFATVMMARSISQFLTKFHGKAYGDCYRMALSASALVRLSLLVLLFPVIMLGNGVSKWSWATSKWFSLFKWGLGISRTRSLYARPGQVSAV